MHAATSSGPRSMRTPRAWSTSAEPQRERRRPIAVLGHLHARPGDHERGCSGDVEGTQTVALRCRRCPPATPGPALGTRTASRAHDVGQAGDLLGRLPLASQPHEERGRLRLPGCAVDYLCERGGRLLAGEVAALGQALQERARTALRRPGAVASRGAPVAVRSRRAPHGFAGAPAPLRRRGPRDRRALMPLLRSSASVYPSARPGG